MTYDVTQTSINLAFTTKTGFAKEKLSNAQINAMFYSSNMKCPITGHEIMNQDATGAYGPWTNTTYIGMNWYQDVEVIVITPLNASLAIKIYTEFGTPRYMPLIINVTNPTVVVTTVDGGSEITTVVVNLPPLLPTPPLSQTQEVESSSPKLIYTFAMANAFDD